MTYKELSEDLIELMNNKTPISLKSLINTVCECKDVERITNIPYKAYATYFRQADKLNIKIEDYLAEMIYTKQ